VGGKHRDFSLKHNRVITNYSGLGPLKLEEFTHHIAGQFLPGIPQELVDFQNELRKPKTAVAHFLSVIDQTMEGCQLSPKLRNTLSRAFKDSIIDETKIDMAFLENLMEALDILKASYTSGTEDYDYLEKLISTIFSFYKLIKNSTERK
jgi:hypothetical protein